MQYIGIIDMEGLDSFAEVDPVIAAMNSFETGKVSKKMGELLFALDMRCRFNGQRHPIIFVCDLDPQVAKAIEVCRDPIRSASLVLGMANKFGMRRGDKSSWEILLKLRPEFKGTPSGEIYPVQRC